LTAAQRALALTFKKLNFRKAGQIKTKSNPAYIGKTSACRNTDGRVDQPAQHAGNEGDRMRQELVARAVNGLRGSSRCRVPRSLFTVKTALAGAAASFLKKRYSGKRGPEAMPKENIEFS
jgi:hypothetical protein